MSPGAPGRLERLVTRHEGLRLAPYRCTGGRLTIGVGRNLDDVGISEAEALYLLANDLDRARAGLDRYLPWWRELDEARRAVVVSMAFQLGVGGLLGFGRALAALAAGRWEEAARELVDSRWARQTPARAEELARMVRTGRWPPAERGPTDETEEAR